MLFLRPSRVGCEVLLSRPEISTATVVCSYLIKTRPDQTRPKKSSQHNTRQQNKSNLPEARLPRDRHLLRSPTLPDRPKPTDLSRQLASSPAPCAFCSPPNSLAAPLFLCQCTPSPRATRTNAAAATTLRQASPRRRTTEPPPPSIAAALSSPCLAAYLDVWTSQPPMLQPAIA